MWASVLLATTRRQVVLMSRISETRMRETRWESTIYKRPSRSPHKSNLELSTIRLIWERSCRLYNALQHTGNCSCPRLNLRLGFDSVSIHSRDTVSLPSQTVFKLVAVFKAQHSGLENLMDVDGLPEFSEEQLQALEVKSRLLMSPKAAAALHCDDSPSYNKSTCVPAPKPAKKRVGFSLDLAKMAGKRHPIAEEGSPSPRASRRRSRGYRS
jgi:hypothetical protein